MLPVPIQVDNRVESEKERLLSNPDSIDRAIANITDYLSPSAIKVKGPKTTQAIEEGKHSDDPTKGFGVALRDNFTQALMSDKFKGVPAGRLLQSLSYGMVQTPDESGSTLIDKVYKYTRTENSSLFGSKVKHIPGYDEWYKDKRLNEAKANENESWLPSVGDVAESAATTGLIGAGLGLVGGGIGGALSGAGVGALAGAGVAGPPGALVGGLVGGIGGYFGGEATGAAAGGLSGLAAGALGEVVAKPLKKLIHKTDWYQGMIQSNSLLDNTKARLADLATYLPGGILGDKGLDKLRGISASKIIEDAGKQASEQPLVQPEQAPKQTLAQPGSTISEESVPIDKLLATRPAIRESYTKPEQRQYLVTPEEQQQSNITTPNTIENSAIKRPGDSLSNLYAERGELYKLKDQQQQADTVNQESSPLAQEDVKPNQPQDEVKIQPGTSNVESVPINKLLSSRPKTVENYFQPEQRQYLVTPTQDAENISNLFKVKVEYTSTPAEPVTLNADLENHVSNIEKAASDLVAKPTAANLISTDTTVKNSTKSLSKSNIVDSLNELSPKGEQEAGLAQITDKDVTRLPGKLSDNIPIAIARDKATSISIEPSNGPLRTQLAENNKERLASTVSSVTTKDASTPSLSLRQEKPVTPEVKRDAILNVESFSSGGESIEQKLFPEQNITSLADAKKMYYEELGVKNDAGRIAQMIEEARSNLEINNSISKDKIPITKEAINKEYDSIKALETENFLDWAKSSGLRLLEVSKKFKLITGMLALGVTAPIIYDELSGKKAEAGMLSSALSEIGRAAVKEAAPEESKLLSEMLSKNLISVGATTETALLPEHIQKGLIQESDSLKKVVLENIRKNPGTGTHYALMSPYQVVEAIFKTGEGKTINPATNLASFITAGSRTAKNAETIALNILKEGKVANEAVKVKDAFNDVVPLAYESIKLDTTKALLGESELRLKKMTTLNRDKMTPEDIQSLEGRIQAEAEHQSELKTYIEDHKTATEGFHNAWLSVAQPLSRESQSFRLALSLEDPERKLYPWLQALTRDESVAAGKLRILLDTEKSRMVARDIPVLDNYLPHSPHPDMQKLFAADKDSSIGGIPFSKFYKRTANSRPLAADIYYTMQHYVNDIEPRLQFHDFANSGWKDIKNSEAIQSNPALKRAFDQLFDGSRPANDTWGNTLSNRYSEFEAVHQLFLSPSSGLKHLVKITADIVSAGPTIFTKSIPDSASFVSNKILDAAYGLNKVSIRSALSKIGINVPRFGNQLMNNYLDSVIASGNMRKYMYDMGIDSQESFFNTLGNLWKGVQDVGSSFISLAELGDRAVSATSAIQMAAKKGMTVDQAVYGAYDLILKNNFLFNQFNPTWLNNPKIRSLLMFQATPFKILERRVVAAQRSLEVVKSLSKQIQDITEQPGGIERVLSDLKNMRAYMREGQSELKANLIIDTLNSETDFFGTPIVKQFLMDALTIGAFTYGGTSVGLNLQDHFFHIPFLSTQSKDGKAELAVSPVVSGVMQGYNAWKKRGDSEDFLLSQVMRKWLGPYGPLPRTLEKAVRLSNDDIPEIYRKGGGNEYLKYLFSIPGNE